MVSDKALILHKCIPRLWYQGEGHLSKSNTKVTLKKKTNGGNDVLQTHLVP